MEAVKSGYSMDFEVFDGKRAVSSRLLAEHLRINNDEMESVIDRLFLRNPEVAYEHIVRPEGRECFLVFSAALGLVLCQFEGKHPQSVFMSAWEALHQEGPLEAVPVEEVDDVQSVLRQFEMRDGVPMASSLHVAVRFGKSHRHVVRSIRQIESSMDFGAAPNFERSEYIDATGRSQDCYWMDRDTFSLLAMGFTGKKAMEWKWKYIQAFNAMEKELQKRSHGEEPAPANGDLASTENVLATITALHNRLTDQQVVIEKQTEAIEEMSPKVNGFNRICEAEGSLCFTDAAKSLQMTPGKLTNWLAANGWIYKRPGTDWIGYQSMVNSGDLEHKIGKVQGQSGSERVWTQCRITAKGIATISRILDIGN